MSLNSFIAYGEYIAGLGFSAASEEAEGDVVVFYMKSADESYVIIYDMKSLELNEIWGCVDTECAFCLGAGTANCAACKGEGKVFCAYCYGLGIDGRPCQNCGGTGMAETFEGFWTTCGKCKGAGFAVCAECGGEGRSACRACLDGAGKVKCEHCGGTGLRSK